MPDFDDNVAGVGALADPIRRQLYRYVCSQAEPVSRDQAAEAVGIARHKAKFHLDRLEAGGLLETDYARLSGRTGPGSGRPAKRYRRASDELAVTLPPRRYDVVAHILADAIADASAGGRSIQAAVTEAATAHGTALAADPDRAPSAGRDAVEHTLSLLTETGYEPKRNGPTIVLLNCPFHRLARRHTELVCRLNHAFISGLATSATPDVFDVRLEPGEQRCCVTLTALDGGRV